MKVISCKEARALGLNRYFTGKPCKRGHIVERYLGGECVECVRRPERKVAKRSYDQQHYQQPKIKAASRDSNRRLYARQGNYMQAPLESECPPRPDHCECCGVKHDPATLCLDHDHDIIGSFLGWTCNRCNVIGDDLFRLQCRVAYLIARGYTPIKPTSGVTA